MSHKKKLMQGLEKQIEREKSEKKRKERKGNDENITSITVL